jgi:glucokinase
VSASGRAMLGIDIGGTTFTVVLLEPDGRVAAAAQEPMPIGLAPAAVLKTVATVARALAATAGHEPRALGAIGLAVPGSVDAARGILRSAPNLSGWRDVPVAAIAAEALETPVALEHDVRMAAYGESRLGVGRGAASFVCVTVGTGIGAALVLDGALYRGASDAAGEIGHVRVTSDRHLTAMGRQEDRHLTAMGRQELDEPCGCGRRGCLETVASGRAIAQRARRLAEAGDAAGALALADGDVAAITARHVFAAAATGDAACGRVVEEAVAALASGLTVLVNVLNPEIIAIGGGVAEAGAALLDRLRAGVRAAAWSPAADVARIVPVALGTRAGAIGAALYAAERGGRRTC